MKVAVSVFRKRASAQRHNLDVQLYPRSVLAHLPGLPPDELANYLTRHLIAWQHEKRSSPLDRTSPSANGYCSPHRY